MIVVTLKHSISSSALDIQHPWRWKGSLCKTTNGDGCNCWAKQVLVIAAQRGKGTEVATMICAPETQCSATIQHALIEDRELEQCAWRPYLSEYVNLPAWLPFMHFDHSVHYRDVPFINIEHNNLASPDWLVAHG